jgi:hypothetical protein
VTREGSRQTIVLIKDGADEVFVVLGSPLYPHAVVVSLGPTHPVVWQLLMVVTGVVGSTAQRAQDDLRRLTN